MMKQADSGNEVGITTFPKKNRLLRRGEFIFLGKRGKVFSVEGCSAQWIRTDRDIVRLGITVPVRFGSSVERNLFKRRVREAFRKSTLRSKSNIDINVRPQKTLPLSFSSLVSFFNRFDSQL
jgi:ribonuclease P protein component